jgi:hypothetical protein
MGPLAMVGRAPTAPSATGDRQGSGWQLARRLRTDEKTFRRSSLRKTGIDDRCASCCLCYRLPPARYATTASLRSSST